MPKRTRKYDKPLTLDMDFDEAVARFANVKPSDITQSRDSSDLGPLPVVLDETGDKFVIFSTPKGEELQLRFDGDEPWATRKQMAALHGVSTQVVDYHVKNIHEGEEFEDPEPLAKLQRPDDPEAS